jgi:hypothetical protein
LGGGVHGGGSLAEIGFKTIRLTTVYSIEENDDLNPRKSRLPAVDFQRVFRIGRFDTERMHRSLFLWERRIGFKGLGCANHYGRSALVMAVQDFPLIVGSASPFIHAMARVVHHA